jgi:hypothetical protein
MNTYTYNDVSWRVHGEINSMTVAVHHLKAKEAHQWPLTDFLGHAMGVMSYTCTPGPITYTITETDEGYTFRMEWKTSRVKAEAIVEYTDRLKGPGPLYPGTTDWRRVIKYNLEGLLGYSSEFTMAHDPVPGTDHATVRMEAMVKFSSLVSAPHIRRLYADGPQRQLSIFDVFEHQWAERRGLRMRFLFTEDRTMTLRVAAGDSAAVLTFGRGAEAHRSLVRFLQAIRNIIHSVEEKLPVVNVATMATTRYYDDENPYAWVDQDDTEDEVRSTFTQVLHTRYVHFREDFTHCSMDMQALSGWTDTYQMLIREDAELQLEDGWFYRNGEGTSIRAGTITRSELEAPLRLALVVDGHTLRDAVRMAFDQLLDEYGPGGYEAEHEAEPPRELVEQVCSTSKRDWSV